MFEGLGEVLLEKFMKGKESMNQTLKDLLRFVKTLLLISPIIGMEPIIVRNRLDAFLVLINMDILSYLFFA